jgi:hypothetical protein
MKQPIQISIPQPCHEDWSKMTPTEQGRFCNSCQKCLVDFTGFTDRQLFEYLNTNKGLKICGRFENIQLDRPINIPPQPQSLLYQCFIALGLTLILSQAPTQNINASPLKTDLLNVQFIADDSIKTKTDTAMKYYIDGTEYISPKRTNICMGAIDQVEVLQSGTSAKYDGQVRELNQPTSPPTTTERKNTFKRNKQR